MFEFKEDSTWRLVFGLETQYGPVIVRMPSGRDYAFVEAGRFDKNGFYDGKAHVNDDRPALEYRGDRYVGSMRLYRNASGNWEARESYSGDRFTRGWSGKAPVSYQAAMVKAIIVALSETLAEHPELEVRADAVYGQRLVQDAKRDLADAEEKLREAKAEVAVARKALRDAEKRS